MFEIAHRTDQPLHFLPAEHYRQGPFRPGRSTWQNLRFLPVAEPDGVDDLILTGTGDTPLPDQKPPAGQNLLSGNLVCGTGGIVVDKVAEEGLTGFHRAVRVAAEGHFLRAGTGTFPAVAFLPCPPPGTILAHHAGTLLFVHCPQPQPLERQKVFSCSSTWALRATLHHLFSLSRRAKPESPEHQKQTIPKQ